MEVASWYKEIRLSRYISICLKKSPLSVLRTSCALRLSASLRVPRRGQEKSLYRFEGGGVARLSPHRGIGFRIRVVLFQLIYYIAFR